MKIKILLLFVLLPFFLFAEEYTDWSLSLELRAQEESDYYSLEISPSIYEYARQDLGDIRLVDGTGEVIPWILVDLEKYKESGQLQRLIKLPYEIKEIENSSHIILNNSQKIPISTISIEAEGTFFREVQWGKRYYPFKQYLAHNEYGWNDFSQERDHSDSIELIINNKENSPVEIRDINCYIFSQEIRFPQVESWPVVLYAGNEEATYPNYDLLYYRSEIYKELPGSLEVSELNILSNFENKEAAEAKWQKIFQISLVGLGILVVYLVVSAVRKT